MAFDIDAAGGYGSSTTDYTAANNDIINHYAAVTAITATSITLDDATNFSVGDEFLYHVSLSSTNNLCLGKWAVANITAKSGNVITVDKDLTSLADLATYSCQVVRIPHYKNFTLPGDVTLSPPAFADGKGGIFILKCAGKLTIHGKLDLANKGIPVALSSSRVLLEQEHSGVGVLDTDTYAGWENSTAQYRFPLNVGDGAAILLAQQIWCSPAARIGGCTSATGIQYCRGASDSPNKIDGTTNIGGSNIMIVADSIVDNSVTRAITKWRYTTHDAGKGLARCYIATKSKLVADEGLYSCDVISDPSRLKNQCNIKDFGDGSDGYVANPAKCFNVYASVSSIDGKKIYYSNKTDSVTFKAGALVMIHFCHKSADKIDHMGRFWLAKVISDSGSVITVDSAPPNISLADYAAQVVLIPQYQTLNVENFTYDKTPKYQNGRGGICAFAVKYTAMLSGAVINVERKGGAPAYGKVGMAFGNPLMADKLPVGEGHGSVFILAQNIKFNNNTRIGATYDGKACGGESNGVTGGYRGKVAAPSGTSNIYRVATGGSPAAAGTSVRESTYGNVLTGDEADTPIVAGYASNCTKRDSVSTDNLSDGCQGAHIFIVADKITNFSMSNISTGGQKGGNRAGNGGAGYGGGGAHFDNNADQSGAGGVIAGGGGDPLGGGGTGFAFVYCNNTVNQSTDGIVLDNP